MILLRTSLLFLLILAVGCGGGNKPRTLAPDPTFSVNVVAAPADWPDDKRDWPEDPALAAAQQEVFDRYGAPDFFRFLWFRDGRLATQAELVPRLRQLRSQERESRMFRNLDMEWIYLDEGFTYRFRNNVAHRHALPDTVRIVTEYGDPQNIRESRDASGDVLIFQYFAEGKIFYFREGMLIRTETQPAMGGMIMRR